MYVYIVKLRAISLTSIFRLWFCSYQLVCIFYQWIHLHNTTLVRLLQAYTPGLRFIQLHRNNIFNTTSFLNEKLTSLALLIFFDTPKVLSLSSCLLFKSPHIFTSVLKDASRHLKIPITSINSPTSWSITWKVHFHVPLSKPSSYLQTHPFYFSCIPDQTHLLSAQTSLLNELKYGRRN